MKSVLIVDDEAYVRTEIKERINWRKYGYERLIEADNGHRGLECFRRECPDLVLTDIRMPVMDGIAFCSELRKLSRKARIVVLSSYMDFEYVRQAFKLGVIDYLPKHQMDDEHVAAVLARLDEEEKEDGGATDRLGEKVGMRHWLTGASDYRPSFAYASHGAFTLLHVRIDDYRWLRETSPLWSNPQDMEHKLARIADNWRSDCKIWTTDVYEGAMLAVADFSGDGDGGRTGLHSHIRLAQQLQNRIKELLTLDVSVLYLSGTLPARDLPSAYPGLRQESGRMHRRGEIRGTGQRTERRPTADADLINSDELRLAARCGDIERVKHALHGLWIGHGLRMDRQELAQRFGAMMLIYYDTFGSAAIAETRDGTTTSAMNVTLEHFTSFEGLYEWSSSIFAERLRGRAAESASKAENKQIREILDHIHAHPDDDLALSAISDKFHFNKNYLSELFKQEVGINYTQYITNFRMEQAKMWLTRSDLPIQEISERVGFNDVGYFIKTFGKFAGVSPVKFRKSGVGEGGR